MKKGKRKKSDQPIFESIRKPTAPPSQRFGDEKSKEKADPALRKTKHKRRTETGENDGDI